MKFRRIAGMGRKLRVEVFSEVDIACARCLMADEVVAGGILAMAIVKSGCHRADVEME